MTAIITLQQASENLKSLRGQARVRTLGTDDLLQALNEARYDGYGIRAAETVANCYGYPANRMRLLVIARPDSYVIFANWGNAKKGSSDCALGGHRTVWQRQVQILANGGPLPKTDYWILSRKEVNAALAVRRRAARQAAALRGEEVWPTPTAEEAKLRITREDSRAAGNCVEETERVAKWFKQSWTTIAALRRAIMCRAPHLISFARRAAEQAISRHTKAIN